MQFRVTQKHINKGGSEFDYCPVRHALLENCPAIEDRLDAVYESHIALRNPPKSIKYNNEKEVHDWISNNDAFKRGVEVSSLGKKPYKPQPFMVDIDLPSEYC